MAKESINKYSVAGKIVEIEHRTGVTKAGKPYISGTVHVESAPDNIVPIDFFAQETTNTGKENPIMKSLQTVVEEYKTITKDTREEADIVEISGARISENIFFPQPDRKIRGFRINGAFFNRNNNASPKNEFTVSGEIVEVVEDVENDVPTGTLTVRLLVVGYKNKANIIDFKVEDPAGVKYVQSTFVPDMEVKVNGSVIIDETLEEIKEEVAFGEPIVNTSRKVSRKLVIKSATAPVSSSIPPEEKANMLAVRESEISDKKAAASASTSAPKKSDFSL